jgi:hypothetical protein
MKWLKLVAERDMSKFANTLHDFVRRMPYIKDAKVSASVPVFSKQYLSPVQRLLVKPSSQIIKILSTLGIRVHVLSSFVPRSRKNYVLVWKTIASSECLDLLDNLLDNKRLLHVFRHPCGIISSRLRGEQNGKFGTYHAAEDFELFNLLRKTTDSMLSDISLNDLKSMKPLEREAWSCIVSMEKALQDIQGRPDCKVTIYEDLCVRPHEMIRELFDFCNLDFEPRTSGFILESTSRAKKKYYSVFKNPIESAFKWKKELAVEDQKLILNWLRQSSLSEFWLEE